MFKQLGSSWHHLEKTNSTGSNHSLHETELDGPSQTPQGTSTSATAGSKADLQGTGNSAAQ